MVLWAGDGSAAAGRCAARLRHLGGIRTDVVEIATLARKDSRKAALRSGRRKIVHRVDEHLLPEITAGAIPTTSIRRTVLDLCGRRDPHAESCLDGALRSDLETVGSLWLYLEQEWMRGRRGVAILRDLLAPRTAGQAPSDSEMELEARRRIREEGLPQPIGQHAITLPFSEVHVDLAYPQLKLAIELDSYSWHLNRAAMERDRERDNALHLLGWVVLRFTWAMLRYDRMYVRKTIRDMHESLTASLGPL